MVRKLFLLLAMLFFAGTVFSSELYILSVSNSSIDPSAVYSGDVVTLNFNVKNISGLGAIADDVNVMVELNENYFEPIKSFESIGSLKGKSSKTVSLRFKAKDNVLPGNYTVPIFLTYIRGTNILSQKEEVSFSVSSCKVLKVEDISLSNFKPHIGESLTISASVTNSCSSAARNVAVNLLPVSNTTIDPFIVSAGTQKKIDVIPPFSSKAVEFSLFVSGKVAAETYVFSLKADCADCNSATNSFSFLVLGKPEIVFSNIEYSVENALGSDKKISAGSLVTFSVQLDNIGEEKAKSVEVTIDFGDSIGGSSKSFLGNIDADDSGAAIFNLNVPSDAAGGEHIGTIIVSYTDELGVKQAISETYPLYVVPVSPPGIFDYAILLVLLAVVLGIVYFIIKFVFRQLAIRKSQSR